MDANQIRAHVESVVSAAHQISDDVFGYYLVMRGPSPGAMPSGALGTVSFSEREYNEAIGAHVYGWACYSWPLSNAEVEQYELVPDEHNQAASYPLYTVEITRMDRSEAGKKRIAKDVMYVGDGADRRPFMTRYKGIAAQAAKQFNDSALDTNTKDRVAMARVMRVSPNDRGTTGTGIEVVRLK